MPATLVPWPLSSMAGVPGLTQFVPLTTSRSVLARSTPVSRIATAPPGPACTGPMRRTPGGTISVAAGVGVGDAVGGGAVGEGAVGEGVAVGDGVAVAEGIG